jgi:hypothetical protein
MSSSENPRSLAAVEQAVELPDGYAFRFRPDTGILLGLAEFVRRERLCCPFFHFEIALEANEGPLWLRLTGSEAVKEFVRGMAKQRR